jgi:hypothetical protein
MKLTTKETFPTLFIAKYFPAIIPFIETSPLNPIVCTRTLAAMEEKELVSQSIG